MSNTILIVGSAAAIILLIVLLIFLTLKSKKKKPSKETVQQKNIAQPPPKQQAPPPKPTPLPQAPAHNKMQSHVAMIKDFYNNFDGFNNDVNKMVRFLNQFDYDDIDKGELKDFLQKKGMSLQDSEKILLGIFDNFSNKKKIKIIEREIPHYRNVGWDDKHIKEHFTKIGYTPEIVEEGFREYHKKRLFDSYMNQVVKHMKPFVESGKSDDEIITTFVEHKWPRELVKEALEKCKDEFQKERSTRFLEQEILKLILQGEEKEYIAKTLAKRGWPDDELKKHYLDLSRGIEQLRDSLEKIDLNEYNINKIKEALARKNWPEDIIEKTIKSLVAKVEYHRNLEKLRTRIHNLLEKDYFKEDDKNSLQLRDELISEGWDKNTIAKIINKINKELASRGEKEKIKQFNSHIFMKNKDYLSKDFLTGFDTPKKEEQETKKEEQEFLSKNSLEALLSIAKSKNSSKK